MSTTVRCQLARVRETIGHRGYVPVVLALLLVAVSQYSYLLFQSLAEIITVIVAVTAFVAAWNSYPFTRNHYLMYLGCGYFWIGALDLVHALLYKGMALYPVGGANAPIRFWIATRYFEALLLLSAPLFLVRPLRRAEAFALFGAVAATLGVLILNGYFPHVGVEGQGSTRFRIASEYAIIALLAGAMMHLWYRRALLDERVLSLILAANVFTICAELAFAFYPSVYGLPGLLGHIFRLFAFWLVYTALVEFALTQPFRSLARTANTYDAVPDPILVVDRNAIVRGANEAACAAAGLPRARILGQSCHALFHPPEVPPGECPVCRAIGRGEALAAEELRFGASGRRVEVTLSPIGPRRGLQAMDGLIADSPVVWAEGAAGMVHVSHDVTVRAVAEEVARRSGEQFRALVNGTNDAIFIHDWEGRILEVNQTAADFLGYRADELRRMSLRDIDSPEFAAMIPARLEQLRRHGRAVFETAHMTRGGRVMPVEVSARVFEYDGTPAVLSVARDISGRRQAEAAVWESTQRFATLLAASPVGVFETDEQGSCIYVNERWQEIAGLTPAQAAGDGWTGALHPEDRVECVEQWKRALREGALFHQEFRIVRPDGAVSWVYGLAAPLRERRGNIIGYVGTFTDITESKLADIALHKVNRALKTLGSGNEVLVRATDEAELLREMCRVIVEAGGYRMAWVGFAGHDDRKSVRTVARHGGDEVDFERAQISWADTERGRGPTGTAIRTGTRQIVRSALTDPRLAPWRAQAIESGFASMISLPLANGSGEAFGALTIYANEVDAFDDEEVRLLEELANDLSYGIVNLRARADRREGAERLRRSLEDTIQAVATTVEIRDPYTAGHQKRVAALAEALGRELGLPEERIRGLHLAGIVHDIGKVSAPSEILSKPGRLNEIEYNLIQMHTQSGYEILKDVEFPWPIAQMVLQHHERFDGSGYPKGLKGEEILLEARILAVADVIESMSSHRPYRAGLGLEAALEEIRTHRGTDYDPAVVDACLRLFAEKRFSFG